MKNRTVVFPCRVRQGFFAFIAFFAVYTAAAPQVGFTLVKSGSNCKVRISGSSIGAIKSGEIVCDYATQLDIDNALVYSPLNSIVVGASVDRVNHKVKLIINTTGKVSIENSEIIVIDLKLSGSEADPLCRPVSAVFTDSQGLVKNAQILPVGIIKGNRTARFANNKEMQISKSYLLNGKTVPKVMEERFRNEMIRGDVFLRIVRKR
jgi:hypothetical protein